MEPIRNDVTLVVPVRDEGPSIDSLAASIAAQVTAPSSVVFVDGGSLDDTVVILRRWAAAHPTWRVIEAGPATPGRGRNVGIEAATTAWIALTDAGMVLDDHWLARLVELARERPDVGVVYGHRDYASHGFWGHCLELVLAPPTRWTERGPRRPGSVPCSLLRRDAWQTVGGFPDLRAAEDGIFIRRLEAAGIKAASAPEARNTSMIDSNMLRTFNKLRLYSRVNVEAGEQSRWHHGVARQWIAAAPFLVAGLRRRWLWAIPVLGLLARAARFVAVRREGRSVVYVANPGRLAGVATVLLVADAATFAGWLDAWRGRRRARAVRG